MNGKIKLIIVRTCIEKRNAVNFHLLQEIVCQIFPATLENLTHLFLLRNVIIDVHS